MIQLCLLLIAATSAAAQTPPQTLAPRPGKANDANLAAMARPIDLTGDLALPVPTGPANGHIEAAAVARLLAGKARDLMRENSSQSAGGNSGGAPR